MVKEFTLKPLTWAQRKELTKVLEASNLSPLKIAVKATKEATTGVPIDFIELAFKYGIEGYDDVNNLAALREEDLLLGAMQVFMDTFFKAEVEKKS